ncbi:putative transporter [Rhodopirellula sallentina]|uniref:Potassium uptake protein TrkA n=1 Tax=Rhodopirellula sallentina SM41 TaxID=1263870 RepID=M5UBV1_9BACT|nr:putative transporter [Rhodopirellula sallentina]EMI53483.1 potassium uptake protein TrkA [Rhodopirellula sallentina SM41]
MNPVTFSILAIVGVAVGGLVIGGIRVRKIGLGSAGVMFVGILAGHWGATLDHDVAEFAKEFGLVLFVFTIGLQLGPGIVQLWKDQGLVLNGLAVGVVVMGVLLVLMFHSIIDLPALAAGGLFSGATTNTPSLGAAQQAAATVAEEGTDFGMLASAYAVAYPGGILGIIATMLIMKSMFKIDMDAEAKSAASQSGDQFEPIVRRCIEVDNKHLSERKFGDIPGVEETGVRVSRIKRGDSLTVDPATDQTVLHAGDVILVVGTEAGLDRFEPLIGKPSDFDLMEYSSNACHRRIVVTDPEVINKTLRDLSLDLIYNATITRIIRSGVEMPGRGSSRLQYGDVLHVVSDEESLDRVAKLLGNSLKAINETQFAPVFLGIFVGVVVGMIPISIPGVPFPVKLGLAGGPLIAAIVFSLLGKVGKFVWHIPFSANLALRELGIIMFLASAGLSAGKTFFSVALTSQGLLWMLAGLVITMVPLLIVGLVGRLVFKVNFLTLCGVIAGSMTDPPALAFANTLSDSSACATGYAAVYPLTMVMRIVAAQTIIYILFA